MKKVIFFILMLLLFKNIESYAQFFKIGVATRDITPCTPTIQAAGDCKSYYIPVAQDMYATGGNAVLFNGVESDLQARVIIIANPLQNKMIAMISLDLATLNKNFSDSIKQSIIDANIGIDSPEDILLNISHTHNSPAINDLSTMTNFTSCGLVKDPLPPDTAYLAQIKQRILSGTIEAIDSLKTCFLYYGSKKLPFGKYRRTDNKIPFQTSVLQDINVLKAVDTSNGEILAIACFAACHSTTMWGTTVISADFPSSGRQVLESYFSASSPRCKAFFFKGLREI